MNIVNIKLKPPKPIAESLGKDIEKSNRLLKISNLKKGDDSLSAIMSDIKKKYDSWDKRTKLLRSRLRRYNDLIENVVSDSNFPYPGASNITLGYAASLARTFKAAFNRAVYQDSDLFSAATDNESIPTEVLSGIEQATNYYFSKKTNGVDKLKEGTIPCLRDGTLIVSAYWDRRIERVFNKKVYKDAQEFINDYPNPDDAGITPEQYNALLDNFIMDPETEIHVRFFSDIITRNQPRYDIIPLARFIFYPVFESSIEDMQLYGSQYLISREELEEKGQRGEFYPKQVEKLLEINDNSRNDKWSATTQFIEGITQNYVKKEEVPYRICDCVYKADLDDDGIMEKYFVTFNPDRKIILSFRTYELFNNIDSCVDFRFQSREASFLGVSLLGDNEDKLNLLDTLHRHRNNIRTLVTAPIMLALKSAKQDIDWQSSDNIIRPGMTLWVNDLNSIKQLVMQNLDQPGNSMDEENLLTRYVEMSFGVSQGLSGQQTPNDPRAPMGKTIALLQQANQRVDDYIDEFRKSLPKLARLQMALIAQYGQDALKYSVEDNGMVIKKEIDKKILSLPGIDLVAKRRSLNVSPEFSMQRLGGLINLFMQMYQLLASGNPVASEMWNRMVVASGETDKERLMVKVQTQPPPQAPGAPGQQMPGAPGAPGQQGPAGGPPGAPNGAPSDAPQGAPSQGPDLQAILQQLKAKALGQNQKNT